MYFKFLFVSVFLINTLTTLSCDICGSYMGLTPYDNKNMVTFLHRYRVYNGYRNYQTHGQFFPTVAYKVIHDTPTDSSLQNKTYSSKDFESYKVFELRLKYFALKRLEINAFIPVLNNKSKNNNQSVSHTGLGDVSMLIGYHFISPKVDDKIKHKLICGLGIKTPTGNYYAHDNFSNRLPFEMQPGTGSWDLLLNTNYLLMIKNWGANINCNFKYNGKNSYAEKLARSTTNFATVFYNVPIKKIILYPSVQFNYEYSEGLYAKNNLVDGLKVNTLMVGPGLDLYYKNISINTSFQLTAHEEVSVGQLKNVGRISVGLNYSFNSKSQ